MSKKPVVRVRDVMKTKFDMVDGMETVAKALETMLHIETKTLVVKKRHDGDVRQGDHAIFIVIMTLLDHQGLGLHMQHGL